MNNKIYKLQNGNILPEITVVPTRLSLSTYYPIIGKNYRYTGHSSLRARSPEYTVDTSDGFTTVPAKHASINKRSSDAGYNFITNNCADATRCALEAITGKKMNPYFFTTPGDVLDFFKENFDDVRKVKSKNSGKEIYYTNITPKQLEIIKEQQLEQIQKNRKEQHKELLANARKWKHKLGGNIIKAQEGSKFGQFLNNEGVQTLIGDIVNTVVQNNNIKNQSKQLQARNKMDWATLKKQIIKQNQQEQEQNYQQWVQAYQSGLTKDNPSQIVAQHKGWEKLNQDLAEGEQALKNQGDQISAQANSLVSNNWINGIGGILQSGLGLVGNYLSNKPVKEPTTNIGTTNVGNDFSSGYNQFTKNSVLYNSDKFWNLK